MTKTKNEAFSTHNFNSIEKEVTVFRNIIFSFKVNSFWGDIPSKSDGSTNHWTFILHLHRKGKM